MHRPSPSRVEDLRRNIVRLAALTTAAVRGGTDALLEYDIAAAARTIDDDDAVDSLRHAIEDECLYLLGQPSRSPIELRQVGTTMRVVYELERSADLMVNIAKTTWRLHPLSLDPVSHSDRRAARRPGDRADARRGQCVRRPRPVRRGGARRHGRHRRRAAQGAAAPPARGRWRRTRGRRGRCRARCSSRSSRTTTSGSATTR